MSVAWPDRFWTRVDCSEPHGCWLWTGAEGGCGYGRGWNPSMGALEYVHRTAYTLAVGPIPAGMEVDHLCRVRLCVNPTHLEVVTRAENMRRTRRTVCEQGHPLDVANTYVDPKGRRFCRTCRRVRHRIGERRRRAERKAA